MADFKKNLQDIITIRLPYFMDQTI